MDKTEYRAIEAHMHECMRDAAHDKHHIYRVLYAALDIASHEKDVDYDILIAACLLHDIGRDRQFADHSLCHAHMGGEMAYEFLTAQRGWEAEKAAHVQGCIAAHRFRRGNPPQSTEAKILFDADKLEAAGAIGLARTFIHSGQVGEPLYILDESGHIITEGGGAEVSSFFQEYNYKLKNVYDKFHTSRAKAIAKQRQWTTIDFYNGLHEEITGTYQNGTAKLNKILS
ncbi:MAG: HD domain-containing protein [Defluviitaleaceae bacterium]|nr:HD domain-containing protein [Defluviitaleaceae bacterium]MCL2239785.1 HD domain-containing protein [Defluviitaleaceae bacterium]